MISVDAALERLFALVAPLDTELVPLAEAAGRVLARDVSAERDQPPFAASSMDGYALRGAEVATGTSFDVIGEAAAGHRFDGHILPGQAVRIFTGAPLPEGADRVVMQEDMRRDGDVATICESVDAGPYVRPAGSDFRAGDLLDAPRRLRPADIALLASMNIAEVPVTKRPDVALMSTGDELVMPGEKPGPDQIIASNTFGLKAMLEGLGAKARILPIAGDSRPLLEAAFDLAEGADLIVTIGGASVGDHDLVGDVAASLGMERAFYKVAMRPGKPLMAGRLGTSAMVGLPGNPVSAMVCGRVFLTPIITAMLGLGAAPAPRLTAPLAAALPENGPREHYMRATVQKGRITAEKRQDSALLSVLADANALLIRPPYDPERTAGETVSYLVL